MFSIPDFFSHAIFGQLLLGLINGSFYALLSLGLAIIFGLMNVINFAHGALYMAGAFTAWLLLQYLEIGYWPALILAPLVVGALGMAIERTMLWRLYRLDNLYGFLLTFGIALVIQALFRQQFGSSGRPYPIPEALQGGMRLPFLFLPYYRAWVIAFSLAICALTWFIVERTKLGSYLRAATENSQLVRSFGVNVPRMRTLTYGVGVALAALGGVLAAPVYQVNPLMGTDMVVVVFAVVVIGGMGSLSGSILIGLALGVAEGLTKMVYPEAASVVVFVVMAGVLVFKPNGLFGKSLAHRESQEIPVAVAGGGRSFVGGGIVFLLLVLAVAPLAVYPQLLMKALCLALLAVSVNLMLGYAGLLSFGHAMFLGSAGYVAAHAAKVWGWSPEWAILGGVAAAAMLGLLSGLIAVRKQGIYFAMTTLALAQMVFFFFVQVPFTGGEDGIQKVPRGYLFGFVDLQNDTTMYYVVLAIFIGALLFVTRVIHSPFGEVLKAIRDNEQRAISLGYKADRYKLMVFTLSAAIAGLGGATKAIVFQLASLTEAHWSTSGEAILMSLVGGVGTVLGPVVGAFAIVAMDNYFAAFGQWVTVMQGLAFIGCVLIFRRGLVGELSFGMRRQL
jgi:branched-chain amino acid transport system permease protein